MTRRRLLSLLAAPLPTLTAFAQATQRSTAGVADDGLRRRDYPHVVPGYTIRFPHDEGSHPAFRTEWWYVTGWLEPGHNEPVGFQVTFFRVRPGSAEANPSAFAARQIVIAHAGLSDVRRGRLLHDQRVARAVFGLAGAEEARTEVWLDDWSLRQTGNSYSARVRARDFELDLVFAQTQPPLLQGDGGLSRKGPAPQSASYYYSVPQLAVSGAIGYGSTRLPVSGTAWLDHEWSSSYMDARASGWDWIGINFHDGSALMAFRMRDRSGETLWAGGAARERSGAQRTFTPAQIEFLPLRSWRSPRTGALYPVAWRVRAGSLEIIIEPLMDDQESDTRSSVGAVYWEGAVRALSEKKPVGRGYLELTGYVQPMRL